MRLILLTSLLLLLGFTSQCQNNKTISNSSKKAYTQFTFEIEKLVPPKDLLKEESDSEIYKKLLSRDAGYNQLKPASVNYNPLESIVAKYKKEAPLVNYTYHSFFDGMYHAYAEHRPFTLSPDMIWLLIMQGFSQHVNNNSEQLRKLFVKHDGEMTLLVLNNKIMLNDPQSPWEEVFPEFTEQIEEYTGGQGIEKFTADFSTTTAITRMASQITLMDAMKKYFEYVVMVISCGIPSVTLEGTPQDWRNLLQKTRMLEKYELGWWTKQLYPILEEFIKTSEKKVSTDFWKSMFKYHDVNGVYKSKMIDGWIVKFFPYNKNGKRNNLDSLSGSSNLPDEICKVNLTHKLIDINGNVTTTPLELWAGFFGLQQDKKDYRLKPEIGWMIKKADSLNTEVLNSFKAMNDIDIRVQKVPKEILALPTVKNLKLTFIGEIQIPDQLKNVKIDKLILRGEISDEETKRIVEMFRNTQLFINNKQYGKKQTSSMEDISTGW